MEMVPYKPLKIRQHLQTALRSPAILPGKVGSDEILSNGVNPMVNMAFNVEKKGVGHVC
jgi:hypothetical protein